MSGSEGPERWLGDEPGAAHGALIGGRRRRHGLGAPRDELSDARSLAGPSLGRRSRRTRRAMYGLLMRFFGFDVSRLGGKKDGSRRSDSPSLRTAFGLFSSDDMPQAFAPKGDPSKDQVYDDEIDPGWRDPSTPSE